MKKCLLVLILMLFLCGCNEWTATEKIEPPPKLLSEYLLPTPELIKYQYGNSERTNVLYNVATRREALVEFEKKIKESNAKIAEMEKKLQPLLSLESRIKALEGAQPLRCSNIDEIPKTKNTRRETE